MTDGGPPGEVTLQAARYQALRVVDTAPSLKAGRLIRVSGRLRLAAVDDELGTGDVRGAR